MPMAIPMSIEAEELDGDDGHMSYRHGYGHYPAHQAPLHLMRHSSNNSPAGDCPAESAYSPASNSSYREHHQHHHQQAHLRYVASPHNSNSNNNNENNSPHQLDLAAAAAAAATRRDHNIDYSTLFVQLSGTLPTLYRCVSCNKIVSNRWHHANIHRPQSHECPVCGQKFTRRDNMKAHCKIKHADIKDHFFSHYVHM
ncbi:uncharacterized protein Dwil_GK28062 [Drosophila willistoni]|uniref:C2H2-type domain-containing protein n=1 Tax=Drosophila willistoni TaxID=7260 RepID=A0A0Q9WVA6_DROWI|nr:uncharacterized protein Dwil_GK28062 [Drosophila willistoni]